MPKHYSRTVLECGPCTLPSVPSRSNPDHAARRAFLAADLSLQFLDLLFEFNNDAGKLIETGANSLDRFSGGLVQWRHPFRPRTHGRGLHESVPSEDKPM